MERLNPEALHKQLSTLERIKINLLCNIHAQANAEIFQLHRKAAENIIDASDFNTCIAEFNKKLTVIHNNNEDYPLRFEPARNLLNRLILAKFKALYSQGTTEQIIDNFKQYCADAMNSDIFTDMKVLEDHRDWNQFIANVLGVIFSIATFGVFTPFAYGLGMFERRTDTMQKAEAIVAAANNIVVETVGDNEVICCFG